MIRIEPKSLLSEEERYRMRDLQDQLDQVELDYVSVIDLSDDLTPEEILKKHVYEAAIKLNETIEVNISDLDITRLSTLESEFSETSQPGSQLSKKKSLDLRRFLWSANTQDNLKDLFQNSSAE